MEKRDFLKLLGLTGAGLLAACAPKVLSPTETETSWPTATKTPIKTPTPTPTETVTPVPAEILECPIPDLDVKRISMEFPDVTNEIPPFKLAEIVEKFSQVPLWSSKKCDPWFTSSDTIRPGHDQEFFAFDNSSHRVYLPNILVNGENDSSRLFLDRPHLQILGWKEGFAAADTNISANGRLTFFLMGQTNLGEYKEASIIVDIPNGKETIVIDKNGRYADLPCYRLSDNGEKLLFNFNWHQGSNRGINLVRYDTFELEFKTPTEITEGLAAFLNEDGSLLYLYEPAPFGKPDYLFNTISGEYKKIYWGGDLTCYDYYASRNLKFVARIMGTFAAAGPVAGQWGIKVLPNYTEECPIEVSSPGHSLVPMAIDNDGTIYTTDEKILSYQNGKYVLIQEGPGGKIEIQSQQIPCRP